MGIASYNLAMERSVENGTPMSHEQALEQTRKDIVESQGDYTDANKPRSWAGSGLARVMTMYKMYPLIVLNMAFTNTKKIKDPATRAEGLKTLGYMTATHGSLAGGAGMIAEPFLILLEAIAEAIGDDDDEFNRFLDDPKHGIQEMVWEATGSETLTRLATGGIPGLLGIDLTSRVGLQSLMFRIDKGDTAMGTIVKTLTNSVMGPIFGADKSFERAWDNYNKTGDALQSLMGVLPKGAKNLWQAGQMARTGELTNTRGEVLREDMDLMDAAITAIGFTPRKKTQAQATRSREFNMTRVFRQEGQLLMKQWVNASGDDRVDVMQEIREYNSNLPIEYRREFQLTSKRLRTNLLGSIKEKALMRKGMKMKPKTWSRLRSYDSYGDF